MASILRYFGQAVVYGGIALLFGYFATRPLYVHFPPGKAALTVSVVHGAQPKEPCRRLTAQEIADLPPNMRKPVSCPRERLPIWIEVQAGAQLLLSESIPPTGLSGDGPSRIHRRFVVEPGPLQLVARLRDTSRQEGYDYELAREIEVVPEQSLVLDFRADGGGFVLR